MDWGNCKDILVFLEQKEGKVVNVSLEALTPARTLAGLTGGKVLALAVARTMPPPQKRLLRCVTAYSR